MGYTEQIADQNLFLKGPIPNFTGDKFGSLKAGATQDCMACTDEAIERMKQVMTNGQNRNRDFGSIVPDKDVLQYQEDGHPFFRRQTVEELYKSASEKNKEVTSQIGKGDQFKLGAIPFWFWLILIGICVVGSKS